MDDVEDEIAAARERAVARQSEAVAVHDLDEQARAEIEAAEAAAKQAHPAKRGRGRQWTKEDARAAGQKGAETNRRRAEERRNAAVIEKQRVENLLSNLPDRSKLKDMALLVVLEAFSAVITKQVEIKSIGDAQKIIDIAHKVLRVEEGTGTEEEARDRDDLLKRLAAILPPTKTG